MLRKLLPLALCMALFACAKQAPPPVVERTLPPVGFESPEFFVNNLVPSGQELTSWKDMGPSVRKSLRYVNSKPRDAIAVPCFLSPGWYCAERLSGSSSSKRPFSA